MTTALLAGASGLVGRELLAGLLADPRVTAVHTLGRRQLALQHPKLTQHVVDFAALPVLPPVEAVYLALGTTIRAAGSQAAFRAVDLEANLAVARAARAAGASRLGLVSAMGANPHSRIFYNRVKGRLEADLAALGYARLVVVRPSLLAGDRMALGQPARRGERLGLRIGAWLRPVLPKKLRPVAAHDVAQALLRTVPVGSGSVLLLSDRLRSGDPRPAPP